MSSESSASAPSRMLLAAFFAHVAATLIHFVHNGVYISEYPNLPAWLTDTAVYTSWCALTAIGLGGLALLRYRSAKAGLSVLVLYALLGFGGLDHYTVAAFAAHTFAMNLTILCEAVTGSLLIVAVVREYFRISRRVALVR